MCGVWVWVGVNTHNVIIYILPTSERETGQKIFH